MNSHSVTKVNETTVSLKVSREILSLPAFQAEASSFFFDVKMLPGSARSF